MKTNPEQITLSKAFARRVGAPMDELLTALRRGGMRNPAEGQTYSWLRIQNALKRGVEKLKEVR